MCGKNKLMKTNGNQLNDRQGRLPNGDMRLPVLLPTGFPFVLGAVEFTEP